MDMPSLTHFVAIPPKNGVKVIKFLLAGFSQLVSKRLGCSHFPTHEDPSSVVAYCLARANPLPHPFRNCHFHRHPFKCVHTNPVSGRDHEQYLLGRNSWQGRASFHTNQFWLQSLDAWKACVCPTKSFLLEKIHTKFPLQRDCICNMMCFQPAASRMFILPQQAGADIPFCLIIGCALKYIDSIHPFLLE